MVPQQRIRLEATEDKQKGKWDILEQNEVYTPYGIYENTGSTEVYVAPTY